MEPTGAARIEEAMAKTKKQGGIRGMMRRVIERIRALPKPARISVGVLLVLAGCVGFLPVLGFWMIPAGLIVLAIDMPWLRRPVRRTQVYVERRWRRITAKPALVKTKS